MEIMATRAGGGWSPLSPVRKQREGRTLALSSISPCYSVLDSSYGMALSTLRVDLHTSATFFLETSLGTHPEVCVHDTAKADQSDNEG